MASLSTGTFTFDCFTAYKGATNKAKKKLQTLNDNWLYKGIEAKVTDISCSALVNSTSSSTLNT